MIIIETKTIFRYIFVALVIGGLFYLFSGRNVSDTENGADKIRNEIETARQNADKLTERLDDIEAGAGTVTSRIEASERSLSSAASRIERIEENIANARAINGECQQIIRDIQKRNEEQTKTD